jgi:hypothetical protein
VNYKNCSDNPKKIFRLLRLQHRWLQRQLRLVALKGSPPRTRANYRQRSGARHQLAPECGNSCSRSAISSTSATAIPTTFGGSTTTLPPIVIVILWQQLDYVIVDYAAPTMPHLIKAKFSTSKSQFLFTFCRTRHSGAPPWKIILHIIDFKKLRKP